MALLPRSSAIDGAFEHYFPEVVATVARPKLSVVIESFEDLLRDLTPQVLGALVRRYGQFDACEDAVQEALLAAATQWPADGPPDNPLGWLIRVASRRLTDL